MSDLSNDRLNQIEGVRQSTPWMTRFEEFDDIEAMVAEIRRHRASRRPTEQQAREVVLRALGELLQAYHNTAVPFDAAGMGAEIAGRAAKELAGASTAVDPAPALDGVDQSAAEAPAEIDLGLPPAGRDVEP